MGLEKANNSNMNIKDILSIAGKPGLYKLIAQSKSIIIVESLEDKKRLPINATQKISSLSDISIYTFETDVPLQEVLEKIFKKEDGGKCIDHKADSADLRRYMEVLMPDYDSARVYDSDLRKLFQWYNLLHENGRLTADDPSEVASAETEETATETGETVVAEVEETAEVEEAPKAKKPRAKKAAPQNDNSDTAE